MQARGRGRAEDSSYTLVDVKNSGVAEKECVNEYRISMMEKAINKIRTLDQAEYDEKVRSHQTLKKNWNLHCCVRPFSVMFFSFFSFHQILTFQIEALFEDKFKIKKKKQKKMQDAKGEVKFSCRGCNQHVCTGEDVQLMAGVHRVNVTSEFR